jgi:hypothetical protein
MFALALNSCQDAPGMCCAAMRVLLPRLLPLVVNQAVLAYIGPLDFASPVYSRLFCRITACELCSFFRAFFPARLLGHPSISCSIAPAHLFNRELASRGWVAAGGGCVVDADAARRVLRSSAGQSTAGI